MSSASYCSFLIPTEASKQTTRRGTTRKITAASVQNGAVVRDSGECVCNISVHRRNGLTTLYGMNYGMEYGMEYWISNTSNVTMI